MYVQRKKIHDVVWKGQERRGGGGLDEIENDENVSMVMILLVNPGKYEDQLFQGDLIFTVDR